ncbi:hypothetical protein TH66_05530 [Carbonactinospora thermoautotrophica]|uniref:TIGR02453 family protein n=2 Tax=Carbonactinospora thermoautotrophica TaxID=1469144 RepID=A0A132N3E7_9ACTN|nr:DUF2461 domain-containing protein [Carbonactinospora thermoautotrophica]KWX04675.1 hypothetical protein TH66_05530 [Carbonactinospora thermoautotrophica]
MGHFVGFSPKAFEFFEGLLADNSKEYWAKHRDTYKEYVKEPVKALVEALQPDFGESVRVMSLQRDTRFAPDKPPYKTSQIALVNRDDGTCYHLELSADGLVVGGGLWFAAKDQQTRMREAIDAEDTGKELEHLLGQLRDAGFELVGDTLKTRPRGYAADHPRIDLLRYESLRVERGHERADWMHTPEVFDRVRDAWRAVRPLNEWFGTHVGPPGEPCR